MEATLTKDICAAAILEAVNDDKFQALYRAGSYPSALYNQAQKITDEFFNAHRRQNAELLDSEEEQKKEQRNKDVFLSYLLWPDDGLFEKEFAFYAKRCVDNYKRHHIVSLDNIVLPSAELCKNGASCNENYLRMGNEPVLPFIRYDAIKREALARAKNDDTLNKSVYGIASDIVASENCLRMVLDLPLIEKDKQPLAISYAIWPNNDDFMADFSKNHQSFANKYGVPATVDAARKFILMSNHPDYEPRDLYDLMAEADKRPKTKPSMMHPVVPLVVEEENLVPEETETSEPLNYIDFTKDEEDIAEMDQLVARVAENQSNLETENARLKKIAEDYQDLLRKHQALITSSNEKREQDEARIRDLEARNKSLEILVGNYRTMLQNVSGVLSSTIDHSEDQKQISDTIKK